MHTVSFHGILSAKQIVYKYLNPTPLRYYHELSDRLGFESYIKHENHLPTRSFKVRGGINYMSNLSAAHKKSGVVTVTRGNHGQSIAYAAAHFGVKATIIVPFGNNKEKNTAMQAFGAELIEHGKDFDGARELCTSLQEERGLHYIHPCMEPALVNGVGTYSLEIFEELPNLDTLIVPIGGGSGICGAITVAKAINPKVNIIGVQAENAPAVYRSWKTGKLVETDSSDTIADGLATRVPFPMPFSIIKDGVHDIILVSEDELKEAILLALRYTHNLAEGAGVAALAAGLKISDRLKGQNVVMIMSGGNIDLTLLRRVLVQP